MPAEINKDSLRNVGVVIYHKCENSNQLCLKCG